MNILSCSASENGKLKRELNGEALFDLVDFHETENEALSQIR